jgi:polar amino acid transport system substrate-binding protein
MRWSRTFALCTLVALAAAAPSRAQTAVPFTPDPPGATHIVVGADPDYPPYEFRDKNGQPAGYNVDLTRAIAEVMGLSVEFRFGTWSEIRAALVAGEIDALEGISYSEERAKEIDFAPPHAIVQQAIFARRETPKVSSLEELRGKKVIVFRGGIMDDTLTQRGMGADLTRTGTPAGALRLLASGEGDYVAVALLPGMYIARELQLTNVVPVARRVTAEKYSFAVRRGNAELLARLNEGLAILKKTGRYDAIHHQWLGVLEPQGIGLGVIVKYGSIALAVVLLLLVVAFLWSRSLQRLVAQRTESLAREVAERRRSEEELRQRQQQLVQADKMAALGVLVSGVAHEINNPVGYILLNMPILKAALLDAVALVEENTPSQERLALAGLPYRRMREELPLMLDEMLAGGRRIKHIVDDLKDFARREDAPKLEAVALDAVVQAAVRLLDNTLKKSTHRFTLELERGLPKVRGNPQRIEQVVVNLLLNACQALPGPERGVRLVVRRSGGEVLVEVIDEGVGIAPENLQKVTDPFFTTKRDTGGTGLGLSVSAGIVKEHGGRLAFDSAPGKGTTATFALRPFTEEA